MEEAALWAKRNRCAALLCSLLISLAENRAAMRQTPAAAEMLGEASRLLMRRDMANGRLGARHAFVGSRIFFQQNNLAAGQTAVARAMDYMRRGSHWLFHIALADRLWVDGAVEPHVALGLYEAILHDPRAEDWSFRPEESLATLVIPHFDPLEHWFELAIQRKDHAAALEITDRVRRHRFFSSLPFGGRMESLRWILEGPEESLPAPARLHRRDLRVALPQYDALSKEAAALRTRLEQAPVAPGDPQAILLQEQLFAELAARSASQEVLLHEVAVSRQPADLVFPPMRRTAEVQKALPDGAAMLVFFVTRRGTYAFLMNNARYDCWLLGSSATLKRKTVALLRALGQFDPNREMTMENLADAQWERRGQEVLKFILEGSQADFTTHFDQLIIVPDGLLWYVPFETLSVVVNKQSEPLISRFQIRYAPTVGLAVPDGRNRKTVVRTGVVVGRLHPRDDNQVAQEACAELSRILPGVVALPATLPAGSALYRVLFEALIVYDDVLAGQGGAYAWQPIRPERPKQGNTLGDWLTLPWGGPQTVILPGFHTAAESGLKHAGVGEAGNEMFLSVCGLMASGVRTVLLSRWRTGGPSSFTLAREFAQELPHTCPAEAWQRAVLVLRDSHMEPEKEPRVKPPKKSAEDTPKMEHPFFWAGYMLVDPGNPPPKAPAKAKPAAKL